MVDKTLPPTNCGGGNNNLLLLDVALLASHCAQKWLYNSDQKSREKLAQIIISASSDASVHYASVHNMMNM